MLALRTKHVVIATSVIGPLNPALWTARHTLGAFSESPTSSWPSPWGQWPLPDGRTFSR